MLKLFSSRNRPVHLGPYPLERLPRGPLGPNANWSPAVRAVPPPPPASTFARIATSYLGVFDGLRTGPIAPEQAPLPNDPRILANELKAACYFLDATLVGICELTGTVRPDRHDSTCKDHTHALVLMIGYGREPESDNASSGWTANSQPARAAMRGAEIACVVAGYVRRMGFPAVAHSSSATDVDHGVLVLRSGLGWRAGADITVPFLGSDYATAVITTTMPLETDAPLAPPNRSWRNITRHVAFCLGVGGTTSGLQQWLRRRRRSDLGGFPMERIKRVDNPTTLVLEDEVPRVPHRAGFFARAASGDLGERTQRERARFATKHPLAHAMRPLMEALVPLQDGEVADAVDHSTKDPRANSRAIKSLAFYLDADQVGICEIPLYAWYSHDQHGNAIIPQHRYAIVMLVDQGHETSEGTSGDDWISGSQSMRAYLRGAEIAGLLAEQIRALGYSARSHTNIQSDVLHIPLTLLAGLGELSRIGELAASARRGSARPSEQASCAGGGSRFRERRRFGSRGRGAGAGPGRRWRTCGRSRVSASGSRRMR